MRTLPRWMWVAALFCLAPLAAWADTIYLKNGEEIDGAVVEQTPTVLMVRLYGSGAIRSIRKSDIDVIIRSPKSEEPVAPPAAAAPKKEGAEAQPGETAKAGEKDKPGAKDKTGKAAKSGETSKTGKGTKPGETAKGGEKGQAGEGGKTDETAKAGEGGKANETAKTGDDKKTENAEEDDENKVPPEVAQAVADALKKLDSDDTATRAEGKLALQAAGVKGIPAMVDGLNLPRPEARAAVASVLGQLGAKNATKALVEVLFAALPTEGGAVPYQRYFVQTVGSALASVTGETYLSVEPRNPAVQDALQKYIAWYNQNWEKLPRQVGEPKIDPADEDAKKKLEDARKLVLAKKDWPVPPDQPASIATGHDTKSPEEQKLRDEMKKAVPTLDRKTGGGFIRDSDREMLKGFFR